MNLNTFAGVFSLVAAGLDFMTGHVGWGMFMLLMAGLNFQMGFRK